MKEIEKFIENNNLTELKKEIIVNLNSLKNYNINISILHEGKRAFNSTNIDTIILNRNGIIVYGEQKGINKENLFKMNLKKFLDYKNIKNKEKIFIYRNGEILTGHLKNNLYVDKNGKKISIFFGDIISCNIENLKNNLIDKKIFEQKLGFIRISDIKLKNDHLLITGKLLSLGKNIQFLFNKKTNKIKIIEGKKEDIKENLEYMKKFNKTFEYFNGQNLFDEPLNEPKGVQLDGSLRPLALKALKKGKNNFKFMNINYNIFKNGKLALPQVCIDFVLDFKEKMANSYYDRKGNKPNKLNFDNLLGEYGRRRIRKFIKKVKEDGINGLFSIRTLHKKVSYNDGKKLEDYVHNNLSKKVKTGDILIIYGKVKNEYHYHSVIVKNIGVNHDIIVLENPSYPKENNLIKTLSRGPKRYIKYIISETNKLKDIYFNND